MVTTFLTTVALLLFFPSLQSIGDELNDYATVMVHGNYSTDITLLVYRTKEYIIHFRKSLSIFPYIVYASSNFSNVDFPIFVMVRQQREATSWEIPLLVDSREGTLSFSNTSRTLCHNNIYQIADISRNLAYLSNDGFHTNRFYKHLSVSVSTVSEIPVDITIRVEEEIDFYLKENQTYKVTISPSQPKYFYYKYNTDDDLGSANTVILVVDSGDETCFMVSIQNAECPVFDLNEDITYDGKYETVNTRGGVIIEKNEYPRGFFIIFVAKGDNYDCDRKRSLIPLQNPKTIKPSNYSSVVTFSIRGNFTKTDYLRYTFLTFGTLLAMCLLFGGVSYGSLYLQIKRWNRWNNEENQLLIDNNSIQNEIIAGTSQEGSVVESFQEVIHVDHNPPVFDTLSESFDNNFQSCNSNDNFENSVNLKLQRLKLTKPMLHDLTIKKPRMIYKESTNYCLNVITIGIFYAIPVVQLVIIHQRLSDETGNLDICYYNFLCAHPYLSFNDYNHVLSNLGYIFFGVLFLLLTAIKEYKMPYNEHCGIPKHYGIYYALGIALTMEGLLSGCYHVCPNQSNFQFDTSFMYVMAVLCIIKLYQNRHPDINANAYFTFLLLAIAVLIAMVGILNGHIWVWIVLIISYSVLCIFLSMKIYFINESRRGLALVLEKRNEAGWLEAITPVRKAWFIYLSSAVLLNILMAATGFCFYKQDIDFGTFLLFLLLGNAVIYTFFYVVMKFVASHYQKRNQQSPTEKPTLESLCYLLLAIITWGVAFKFFLDSSSQWMVSPAQSRQRNTICLVMDFYDNHDIWHFSSASALFFSFMLLLTLDDNLIDTLRNEIIVF